MKTDSEARAYQKGYRAGHIRYTAEEKQRIRDEYWRAAYLAGLNAAMLGNWTKGSPVRMLSDRAKLAEEMADITLAIAIRRGKI